MSKAFKALWVRVKSIEAAPGGSGATAWAAITGKPSTFAPEAHTQAISTVTGLQAALDGKQPVGAYLTAVAWADVSGTPSTFTPSAHTHVIADVTGLQTALDGKQAAGSYQPLATVLTNTTASFTSALETKLSGIATGATANSGDATLLDRANHTGTQTASTISDFTEAAQDVVGAMVAAAGGSYDDGAGTIALPGGGSDPWTWTKLASNSTVSTVAFANVTGMNFAALANTTYLVELFGAYQTAATTTGIGLALDVPAGATIVGVNIVATSATALGGTEQIADANTTGATTGVRAINTNTPIMARWIVANGANVGTVQLMQRSEIAASNTVLQANITAIGRRVI